MTARPYISVKRSLPIADVSVPPFKLPADARPVVTVVHLPFPPSTNDLWRRTQTGMALSKEYKIWKECADKFVMYTGAWKRATKITGRFIAEVVLDHNERARAAVNGRRFDADNRVKAVLDWCQSRELIRNDSDLDWCVFGWGDAPHGCKITLQEVI